MTLRELATSATEDEPDREDLKLMAAEYTVEESGHVRREPIIHLLCRRPDGSRRTLEVEGFYPYFYISPEAFQEHRKELLNDGRVRHIEVPATLQADDRDLQYQEHVSAVDEPVNTLFGQPLVKVVVGIPKHVSDNDDTGLADHIQDEDFDTWEADVFFCQRFLITEGIKTGLSAPVGQDRVDVSKLEPLDEDATPDVLPRTIYLDIEVYTDGTFPEPTDADQPVTAISAYDNYDETYRAWILEDDGWVLDGHLEAKADWLGKQDIPTQREYMERVFEQKYSNRWDADVRVFGDEALMLDDFHAYVADRQPDILTGWNAHKNDNGNGFDFPYLINRSKQVNAWNIDDWSEVEGGSVFTTRAGTAVVDGVELLDLLEAYEKTQIHELKQSKLGYVANKELGYGKEDVDDLDHAYKRDTCEFLKYNIRDTEAMVEIDHAQDSVDDDEDREPHHGILKMFDHLRAVTGQFYAECNHNYSMIDMLFLRDAYAKGVALPTSEKPEVDHYHGADVLDPTPGKSENVFYPDLASLYPYLFYATNMSPETIIGDEQDLAESEWTEDDCFTVYWDSRDEELKKEGYDPDKHDECLYVLKPDIKEGFVRDSIGSLIDMKYMYKGTDKYGAVKRVTNSCFTPDTEVITPDGVRNIRDIEVGDEVYSLNPDSHEMEVKRVTELIEKPDYDDELVTIQNNTIDLKVTPDHRIYARRPRHSDEFEVVDAGDLNDWSQYEMVNDWDERKGDGVGTIDLAEYVDSEYTTTVQNDDEYICHTNRGSEPVKRYYSENNMAELLAWFATEGYANIGSGSYVEIAQKSEGNFDAIHTTLMYTGKYVRKSDNGFKVHNRLLAEALTNLCGNSSAEKKLPSWVFDFSLEAKRTLRRVLMLGDGDTNAKRFSTQSETLRDQFLQLCWELGDPAQYNRDSGVWRVYFGEKNQSFRMNRSNGHAGDGGTEQAENGVYCVQVEDNHTLVAGRNGKFSHIPQCYGVMGDKDTYGKGFRLFNVRIAEAITLAGRKVLNFTAERIRENLQEMGYDDAEIVGGDTDSAMCSVPGWDLDPEALQRDHDRMDTDEAFETPIFRATHETNQAYDDFMAETFGIDVDEGYEHKMEVEVESASQALFFKCDFNADNPEEVGKKKRYSQAEVWDEDDGVIDPPEVDHTGWDLLRSDTSEVTAWAQAEVLERILTSDTPKQDVFDFLEDAIDALKHGRLDQLSDMMGTEVTVEDVGIPKAISSDDPENYGVDDETGENTRTPHPHIRGAKWATQNVEGEQIEQGSKPYLYHVQPGRIGGDYPETYSADTLEDGDLVDAIAVEDPTNLPDEARIDWDKMTEKLLRNPIEDILRTMGWTWTDITSKGRQTGLGAFA